MQVAVHKPFRYGERLVRGRLRSAAVVTLLSCVEEVSDRCFQFSKCILKQNHTSVKKLRALIKIEHNYFPLSSPEGLIGNMVSESWPPMENWDDIWLYVNTITRPFMNAILWDCRCMIRFRQRNVSRQDLESESIWAAAGCGVLLMWLLSSFTRE